MRRIIFIHAAYGFISVAPPQQTRRHAAYHQHTSQHRRALYYHNAASQQTHRHAAYGFISVAPPQQTRRNAACPSISFPPRATTTSTPQRGVPSAHFTTSACFVLSQRRDATHSTPQRGVSLYSRATTTATRHHNKHARHAAYPFISFPQRATTMRAATSRRHAAYRFIPVAPPQCARSTTRRHAAYPFISSHSTPRRHPQHAATRRIALFPCHHHRHAAPQQTRRHAAYHQHTSQHRRALYYHNAASQQTHRHAAYHLTSATPPPQCARPTARRDATQSTPQCATTTSTRTMRRTISTLHNIGVLCIITTPRHLQHAATRRITFISSHSTPRRHNKDAATRRIALFPCHHHRHAPPQLACRHAAYHFHPRGVPLYTRGAATMCTIHNTPPRGVSFHLISQHTAASPTARRNAAATMCATHSTPRRDPEHAAMRHHNQHAHHTAYHQHTSQHRRVLYYHNAASPTARRPCGAVTMCATHSTPRRDPQHAHHAAYRFISVAAPCGATTNTPPMRRIISTLHNIGVFCIITTPRRDPQHAATRRIALFPCHHRHAPPQQTRRNATCPSISFPQRRHYNKHAVTRRTISTLHNIGVLCIITTPRHLQHAAHAAPLQCLRPTARAPCGVWFYIRGATTPSPPPCGAPSHPYAATTNTRTTRRGHQAPRARTHAAYRFISVAPPLSPRACPPRGVSFASLRRIISHPQRRRHNVRDPQHAATRPRARRNAAYGFISVAPPQQTRRNAACPSISFPPRATTTSTPQRGVWFYIRGAATTNTPQRGVSFHLISATRHHNKHAHHAAYHQHTSQHRRVLYYHNAVSQQTRAPCGVSSHIRNAAATMCATHSTPRRDPEHAATRRHN